MRKNETINDLVRQAAIAVNMSTPQDFSELSGIDTVFAQIKSAIDELKNVPAEFIDQIKLSASNALLAVKKLFKDDVPNKQQVICEISDAVCSIQDIIENSEKVTPQPQDRNTIDPADVSLVLDFIAEANEHIQAAEAALLELEKSPDNMEMIDRIFRAFHTIKGVAQFLNLADIGSLAHSAENLLDMARKGTLCICREKIDLIFESLDAIKQMTVALKISAESGTPIPASNELQVILGKLQSAVTDPSAKQTKNQLLNSDPDEKTIKPTITGTDENIKVKIEYLDNLINIAGELAVAQLMVAEQIGQTKNSNSRLFKDIAHQGKLISELQEISMSMRMVPVSGIFQKMTRLVRDLSAKTNKEIKFVTSGGQTELDRTIVDKITDPLVHMIRNCIDHGIETNDLRKKTGKNPVGKIELRAFGKSGRIFIEIEDDGHGLDKDKIFKKAVEKGIIEADAKLTDEQIYKLIFTAGLSTAQKVTNVSGRGVGMDIVKKNIEELQGRIDISTIPGMGTTFTISLPLTLATIDGQIVKVGFERYIVPLNSIRRSFRPDASQIFTVNSCGQMVKVDDELLPVVQLGHIFGKDLLVDDLTASLFVIVEDDGQKCALLINEVLGQQQVVIKNLGYTLSNVPGIYGGAILGDGKVTLILDIPGLIKLAHK